MNDTVPITQRLCDAVGVTRDELTGEVRAWLPAERFRELCDEIDAVDRNLAAELDRSMRLPLDMDGRPVHVGDVMEFSDGATFEVVGVDAATLFYVDDDEGAIHWTQAASKLHHEPLTVERLLRQFAVEVCGKPALTIRSGVVEEYASRLRLAGEDA